MDCPVDFIKINENKARLTAFFVLVLTLVYLRTGVWLIMAFLVVDFSLRTFNLGKYSLIGFVSDAVIKQLNIKNKPVDRAPKRFAAGVGLVFTAAILAVFLLAVPLAPMILAVVMALFALLESFFGFCAGCYVYDFGKKISLFK
jgi:uncharacterized membrane protein YccF (DUF307 family)